MQKLVIGLSALLLAAGSTGVVAQVPAAEMASASYPDCNYVCVFSASVDELRTVDRSQAHLGEPRPERNATAEAHSEALSAMARQVHAR